MIFLNIPYFNKKSPENKVIVFLISNKIYQKELLRITKSVANKHSKVVYICLDKPAKRVMGTMRENNIDTKKFLFIEGITEKVKVDITDRGIIFINSPKNFKKFSKELYQIINDLEKIECLILDSLNTLLIYKDESTVVKFIHALITYLRAAHASGDFICLLNDSCTHLAKTITPFTDKVCIISEDGKISEVREKKASLEKKEKIQSLVKELKAIEQALKSGFLSEKSYLNIKERIETTLKRLRK